MKVAFLQLPGHRRRPGDPADRQGQDGADHTQDRPTAEDDGAIGGGKATDHVPLQAHRDEDEPWGRHGQPRTVRNVSA